MKGRVFNSLSLLRGRVLRQAQDKPRRGGSEFLRINDGFLCGYAFTLTLSQGERELLTAGYALTPQPSRGQAVRNYLKLGWLSKSPPEDWRNRGFPPARE